MLRATFAFFIALAGGCTHVVQLEPDPLADLDSLELVPINAFLTIDDLSQPTHELEFHAIGRFSDGTRRDVTANLVWTVDDPNPGSFLDPGRYTTSGLAAGHVAVTAHGETLTADASLTVIIDTEVVDGAFPPSDSTLFADGTPVTTDPTLSPAFSYPADGTQFPQGVSRTLFQFDRGAGNDAFRITFESDVLHLLVLTGADRWEADDTIQTILSQTSTGTPIHVGIEGASSAAPGAIYAGPTISMQFQHDSPDGFIYYWSASTNGIMRGALNASFAPKLYPGDATCASCHAVSRDGTAMAMGLGGETLQAIDIPTLATQIDSTVPPKINMGWATYSPDGSLMVVADKGQLSLYNAKTGAPVGTIDGKIHLPALHYGTHPDWSPDGAYIAFAYTTQLPTNMDVKSASIARMSVRPNHTFGPPEVLVAAGAIDNDYFPKYSPDGTWIAYVHASTSSHAAISADLHLVNANGGIPLALHAASHRVGTFADMPDIADTMPTWAPVQGERAWLAFASARPYGAVLPTSSRAQIWLSAIDLASAAPNTDPSAAAFWLPCQDVTVLNNNPIWAINAIPPP